MTASDRGTRFVAAFNDIEGHLRAVLGADEHVPFINLAREYAERKRLPRDHLAALVAFASLRNGSATPATTTVAPSPSRSWKSWGR
jgi:hypothetical protein